MTRKLVEDFKLNGLWVKNSGGINNPIITKAARYYNGMKTRCDPKGQHQQREPTYIGCQMSPKFEDFQYFAEWCQDQVGYKGDDYNLDKDIIVRGNKVYGEEYCCFVPREINVCFNKRKASRGGYPIGVSEDKYGNFIAACHEGNGRPTYLGYYKDPSEAFQKYKEVKERYIKLLAERYKGVIDVRVYEALMNYEVLIGD